MQSLNQLRLLVWKNILLRRRYPLFLALELLWPVLILGIVSVLRIGSPPIKTPECHYQKWSMPSAGLVPFLQSLVCNIDNYCFTNQESIETSKQSARSFSALTQDVLPLISSNDILDILQMSNKSIGLLNLFKNVIKDQKFIFGLGEQLYIKYYIRNETEFKNILVNKYQILTLGEFNDIMMSKLNIGKLLNMTEIPDLKSVLCSSEQLGSFFIFPAGTDVKNISIVLCDLELQNNTELINEVLQHLNLSSLIRAIKLIEEIKEKTGSKDNVTFALENVAQMYDIVRNEETLLRAIQALFSIPKLDDLFSVIPYIMENSSALGSMIDLIRKLVFSLNPIMVSLKMDNSTLWGILQDIALLGDYLTAIGDGTWNRSSADLVLPLGDLLYKLNQLSSDSSSAVAINLLKIFADFDWVTLFTELFGTGVAPTSSTNILIDSLIQVLLKGPDLTKALTQAIINRNYTEFTLLVTKVFLGFGLNGTVDPLFLNPIRNLIVAVQSLTNALQNTTSPLPLFVTSIITQLNSALNVIGLSISTICNIVIRSFGQTDPNTYLPLYVTIESIDIMSGLVKIIPELDDLVCILFDKTGLNLNVFWDTLTKIGFWNDLHKIVTRLSNPSQSLNCSKPVEDMLVVTSSISSSFTNDGLNISRMIQCFSLSQEQIQNLLSSFSNYLVLIKNLLNLLQKPAIQKLLTDPDILPLFDLTLEIVIYNSKAMLTVSNLLKSDKNVAQYLLNSGISQLVVETFMNAAVNSNQAYFLQQTSLDITNILCDPDQLSKVMTPSVTASVSLKSLSNAFCNTTLQAAVLAEYLKNSSLSSSGINDLLTSASQFSGMLISLLPSLKDLVSRFSDVTTFFIASVIDTNINILEENIDVLDKIIGSNTMSELSKQLQKLLTPLISLFPPKYKSVTVLTSVQTILNGLVNVDFLKGYLLPEIQVKSLLKYPMNTTNYFTSVLGITQNVAQEILNAVFSSGILQGIANYSSYTCNEVLKRLVFVNATKATLQNVQTEICALNTSQVVKLLNVLIPELDISALISKYTSTLVDTILQDTNITSTELTELAYKINQGLVSSIKTYQMLNQSESKMEIIQSFSAALTSDMPLVDKISQSVCGRIISPDLAAFPSVSGITVSTDTLNLNGAQNKSVDNDLQGTFCQDFFKTINDLEFGSILWNYLKPILLGKILYTPDNEITRTILSKANKTFALVGELNRIATVWANQAVNLQGLLDFIKDTSLLKDLLNNEVIQDILRATTGIQPDLLLTSLPTLENTTFSSDILETLQSVAAMVANYTSCILADRFQPVSNETELENMAFKLAKSKTFFAGIVFYDVFNESETSARQKRQVNSNTIPKHIGYKIRMDIDSVMDTSLLKERTFTMNAEDNLIENLRYLRGFIFLQDLLDSRIIELHKNQSLTNPAVNLIQMPFPCHHADSFIFLLGTYLVPIMMCFVYLSILGVATYNLVYDRENGQDEVLRVMGMIKGVNVLAWFLSTMFMMLTVAIIMAVMLKYTNIFIYSNLFIMFLLLACFSLSSLMLMYMVSAIFNRTSMALLFVIILYLLSYLPFTILIGYDFTLNFWQRILTCFACTTSLCFATLKIAFLEDQGIGVQWSNIDRAGPDELSVAWSFYMMLIDSVIYFLVGWYIQELKPGKYGVGQPFYFPFQLSYWKSFCKYKLPTRERIDRKAHTASSLFEAPPEGVNVGISVENISKIYYNKKVLDQLNLQFYENQITSLLGQNGAAKTTTIKIICGLLKPTSGHVYFNRNFSLVGICPQHNSIFNYMTVREHMEFYSEIKNIKNKKMSFLEIHRLLKEVDLWHARNVPAKNLSYGMKRRLCVALAFVGNTKKIILDEPTSGIDPHTRKHIWNLVTRNRIGRTIVLSTHHLDEADFLSDRIAVMHQGKLLCCGSPSFLKQSVGSGYRLTIMKIDQRNQSHSQEINELRSRSSTAAITTFIQSLCSNATLEEQAGSDLIYNLPKDHSLIVPIDEFFRRLDQSVNHLNIASYGLSDTSLEEIFLKLTKSADQNLSNDTPSNRTYVPNSQSSITSSESENSRTGSTNPLLDMDRRRTGLKLMLAQILALILKRFHHYRRNWRILLSSLILPIIFFLIALAYNSVKPSEGDAKPLLLDPSIYGSGIYSFYQDAAKSTMSNKLVHELTDSASGYGTACMKDWQQNYFKTDKCVSKSPWYNNSLPMYNVECVDSLQTYTSQSTNYLIPEKHVQADNFIQNLNDWSIPYFLINTFEMYKQNRFGGWSFESLDKNDSLDTYVWFNTKGYHSMPSYYNALTNTILRAQLPDGRNSSEYGITAVNHPIRLSRGRLDTKTLALYAADAGLSIMMLIAFSIIPSSFALYVVNEKVMKERQLQDISGISTFTYWTVAFACDLVVYCFTLSLAIIATVIFKPDPFYLKDNLAGFTVGVLFYGWCMIPLVYCLSHFFNKGSNAYLVTFVISLFLGNATTMSLLLISTLSDTYPMPTVYKVCKYLFLIFPQFSFTQGITDLATNTIVYKIFVRFDENRFMSPFEVEILGWKILAMALEGVLFFILNFILDAAKPPVLRLQDERKTFDEVVTDDEDVIREKERIEQGLANDLLIVENLSKVYRRNGRKFFAVNHISFGVPEGQCFGLLGVNGAGKTTVFRMLTGDCLPSSGSVFLKGNRLSKKDTHFGQNVGYCPQEGGLDEYLTAEEMLYFHARLRGLQSWQTERLVPEILGDLGLTQYAHKAVHTYSGGTKRKLALAVALLGRPPILYLDEPTTGMDAATRRLAWKCIEKATRNGQSVILTSHNMNECDSLCSTLAIMVDGEIKCIGSPQHLKHKFGDGYNVTIHKGHKLLTSISHDFVNRFLGSVVKRNHQSSITLQVPTASCSLADVLTFLQAEQRVKNIGFYSLTQTTLDSVFVNFAQDQLEQSQVSGTMKVPKRSRKLSSDLTPFNELNNDMSTSVTNDDLENLNGFRNPAFQRDNHVVLSPAVSYSGSRYVSIIPIGTQSNGNDPMESSHKGLSSYL